MEISSKNISGNIVTNSTRKNKKNTFVINIKNRKSKDACDVAAKDKDSSVKFEFSGDKEKVKKPPSGRHSFSANLKQTLCNIFRIRKLPSPDHHIATGGKADTAGCCVGNGTISANDSVDVLHSVSGKAPFLRRALPPLPATVMLPDAELDSSPLPSPEDGPMLVDDDELGEEPSMDFASSIEKVKDVSSDIHVT
jgi:suppressor of cytokine signaling 7